MPRDNLFKTFKTIASSGRDHPREYGMHVYDAKSLRFLGTLSFGKGFPQAKARFSKPKLATQLGTK